MLSLKGAPPIDDKWIDVGSGDQAALLAGKPMLAIAYSALVSFSSFTNTRPRFVKVQELIVRELINSGPPRIVRTPEASSRR
jgi:hypothetical protein